MLDVVAKALRKVGAKQSREMQEIFEEIAAELDKELRAQSKAEKDFGEYLEDLSHRVRKHDGFDDY